MAASTKQWEKIGQGDIIIKSCHITHKLKQKNNKTKTKTVLLELSPLK